jgi:hypothetical protein
MAKSRSVSVSNGGCNHSFATRTHLSRLALQMTRLVFLDSRDLIDCVEHSDPFDHLVLAKRLRERDAAIVLTMTNVVETIPRGRTIEDAVELMRRLESVPHVFIHHAELSALEFREAVNAFQAGTFPEPRLPFRRSFWRALVPPSIADHPARANFHRVLDGLPMSEQLRFALLDGEAIQSREESVDELAAILSDHRRVLGVTPPNKALFEHAVRTQLAHFAFEVADVTAFSDWMFRSPMVCAGWRLGHEAFHELRIDQTASITVNGLQDLIHVYFLPYVAAATLDKQWREYCRRATRRLAKIGVHLPYVANLYADTAELMLAW